MTMRDEWAEIYEFVATACPPATLPEGIPYGLTGDDLRGPGPADLLDQLLAEFPLENLVASGVVVAESPGDDADAAPSIALHPGLGPEGGGLLLLRTAKDCQPFGLLVEGKLLSSRGLACVAALDDYRCRAVLNDVRTLFFTDSADDLAAMWSLGLAAAPVAGLHKLGGSQLAEFRQIYTPRTRQRGAGSLVAGGDKIPTVVLVGWSPAGWDCAEPAHMRDAVQHLRALKEHLDINLSAMRYWRPDAAELDKLRFILEYGSSQSEIVAAIVAAGQSAPRMIESGETCSELVTAFGNWRRDIANARHQDEVSRATEEILDTLREQFTDPLVALADSTTDPVTARLLMTLAILSSAIDTEGLRLDRRTRQDATARGAAAERKDQGCIFPLIDRFLAIAKVLTAPKTGATR
jgi:hypothetical protein